MCVLPCSINSWSFKLSKNNCRRSLTQYDNALRSAFDIRKNMAEWVQDGIEYAGKEWDLVQVLLENW